MLTAKILAYLKHFWIIIAIVALAIIGDAISGAWGERRFVAAFAEELVAGFLHLLFFGSPILAIYVGEKFYKKSKVLSWIVGIAMFLLVFELLSFTASQIPGVGWRYHRHFRTTE